MTLLAICRFLCYHSLLMLIVSHAFFFFSCKNQSVCIFTLIFLSSFVLVLGFFQPVDYYCLLLLWLQTVPRNKWKKKKKSLLLFPKHGGWCTAGCCQSAAAHAENDSDRQKPSTDSEDDSPDRARSSIFNHVHDFFCSPQSGVISIQMKSRASGSLLSFAYRSLCQWGAQRCSALQQETPGWKRLLKGSGVSAESEGNQH